MEVYHLWDPFLDIAMVRASTKKCITLLSVIHLNMNTIKGSYKTHAINQPSSDKELWRSSQYPSSNLSAFYKS